MKAYDRIVNILDSLTDYDKAELAAMIFNDVDPSKENLERFLETLDDTTLEELELRI